MMGGQGIPQNISWQNSRDEKSLKTFATIFYGDLADCNALHAPFVT